MVGKPTLSAHKAHRYDTPGSSTITEGLNALDQEREASMADEGGRAGAVMERQSRYRAHVYKRYRRNVPRWLGLSLTLSLATGMGLLFYAAHRRWSAS